MRLLDVESKKWLEEHAFEIPAEEIIDDEFDSGIWPEPKEVENMGIFKNINSQQDFNEIIGNIENWDIIKNRIDLYKKWIRPKAIILFGKTWFDKIKNRNTIGSWANFSLFSEDEKSFARERGLKLEETTAGKSIIIKIISKIIFALDFYLEGKWIKKGNRTPGGYIVRSLKNEFIKERAKDLGYKLNSFYICPNCLFENVRTILIKNNKEFSCPRCEERTKSITIDNIDKYKSLNVFKRFIGITCICPNDNCKGYYVPLNSIDFNKWKDLDSDEIKIKINKFNRVIGKLCKFKSLKKCIMPPEEILTLPLECPFCYNKFNPKSALQMKSGLRGESGMLTGLPRMTTWEKKIVDKSPEIILSGNYTNPDNKIGIEEKANIIIDEIILKMSRLKKQNFSSLLTWYFLYSAMEWVEKYKEDAVNYLFGWEEKQRETTNKEKLLISKENKKQTVIVRGKEISIHLSLFNIWMDNLEENISEFNKINSEIKELKDFKWFCCPPKFPNGPVAEFYATLDSQRIAKIDFKTNEEIEPRIARINNIFKIKNNRAIQIEKDINLLSWKSFRVNNLEPGNIIKAKVLMMPGHMTHAPIQRILRLRSKLLLPIVMKIREEENSNKCDMEFWSNRKKEIEEIKKTIKEK